MTTDSRGLTIRIGDRVRVSSYGWALRQSDVGLHSTVSGFTTRGLVQLADQDGSQGRDIANGKAVHGECLLVLDRSGETDRTEADLLVERAQAAGEEVSDVASGEELRELERHGHLPCCTSCGQRVYVVGGELVLVSNHDAACGASTDGAHHRPDELNDPCDACGAERDEDCFPGCIGRASYEDEQAAAKAAHLQSYLPGWCGCEAHQQLAKAQACCHRPDDEPEPGDRCKDCGATLTYVGSGHGDGGSDWDVVETREQREAAQAAEQEAREAAAQAAVVVRSQLLSQPLLAPHLRDALTTLCGFAEVDC